MARGRPPLPPGPYLVVGLARSGVAAALALRAAAPAARVVACDSGEPREAVAEAGVLRDAGVEVHLGAGGTDLLAGPAGPRTVVKSPGVPAGAPVIARARELGLEVTGELEVGWRLVPNEFIAVTGTNGKTTTTELIGAVHRAAGLPVAVAGNVGTPVTALAGRLDERATVCCEASSFQLEDASGFAPECAVFLNLAEDHLDRHATMADYLAAKLRIFAGQGEGDLAVLNAAEPALAGAGLGRARQVWFGADDRCEMRRAGGALWWRGERLIEVADIGISGPHNAENAMAAAAAALARGVEADAVREALRTFAAAPHRLETVARVGEVLFVNDSKATNPHAAAVALRSFERVHAIMGGAMKGTGFASLAPVVAERCRACYLIGEAAERLAADLAGAGVDLVACGDLEHAVAEAARRARPGEVVLLAPACTGFDQYRDYEQRGEHFRALVGALGDPG